VAVLPCHWPFGCNRSPMEATTAEAFETRQGGTMSWAFVRVMARYPLMAASSGSRQWV
jgi:hypothetical protein